MELFAQIHFTDLDPDKLLLTALLELISLVYQMAITTYRLAKLRNKKRICTRQRILVEKLIHYLRNTSEEFIVEGQQDTIFCQYGQIFLTVQPDDKFVVTWKRVKQPPVTFHFDQIDELFDDVNYQQAILAKRVEE